LTTSTPSMKPDVEPGAPNLAATFPAGGLGASMPGRAAITERGVTVAVGTEHERDGNRIILYERLTGDAARQRATGPEPHGAGMPPEAVERVEYIEVWSTPSSGDGYDFRMYSFGGALIACRSTRGH
jgi:hypothetical protein